MAGKASTLVYTVELEPAEEGGFVVSVPALPGCYTQGETYEEALAMAKDAIALWVRTLARQGKPIPMEGSASRPTVSLVQVDAPAML